MDVYDSGGTKHQLQVLGIYSAWLSQRCGNSAKSEPEILRSGVYIRVRGSGKPAFLDADPPPNLVLGLFPVFGYCVVRGGQIAALAATMWNPRQLQSMTQASTLKAASKPIFYAAKNYGK